MSGERIRAQFGRNLSEARGWAGLSQVQLAKQLSMHQKDISRLENGMISPRLDAIVKLADAVGVQVRDLLFDIE